MKTLRRALVSVLFSSLFILPLSAQQAVENKDFSLSWTIVGDRLEVALAARTSGWVSVGFNPSNVMKDANILMLAIAPDGTVLAEDHFGTGLFTHRPDLTLGGTEDVTVISGSEEGGWTRVRFSIPLASADAYDQALAKGKTVKLIVASASSDRFNAKHNRKASWTVTL